MNDQKTFLAKREDEIAELNVCLHDSSSRRSHSSGSESDHSDTRSAFLYGQMQEGLKQNLMNTPNVSGALTYRELVMAAKNEERRQSEMKKRRQYRNLPKTHAALAIKKTMPPSSNSSQPNLERSNKVCDYCHKPGHWKRECRQRI